MSVSVKSQRRQAGTSLLEVLISVVILSIGLLGLAGLQVAALRVNQGAMQRSQATILAYDILDRMRSDRIAAIDGRYDAFATKDGRETTVASATLEDSAIAAVSDWGTAMTRMLPAGEGMICRTDNPASRDCTGTGEYFVIEVRWADENDRDSVANKQTVSVMGQL
jgi:type IV pilus assembly protein PilV